MTRFPRSRLAGRFAAALMAVLIGTASFAAQAQTTQDPSGQPVAGTAAIPALAVPATPAANEPTSSPQPPGQSARPVLEPGTTPAPVPAAILPVAHDMSPWAMFISADLVVKAVMGLLAAASVVTWTIFIAKRLQLAGARFRAVRSVRELLRAGSLFDLDRARHKGSLKAGPIAALVHAAAHERERSANLPADGIKERAAIALGRIEARAARSMTRGTGLVASIGSTAPFVGLFGTVWGIMNSFVGISQAHTTNLAVVAPGIAEALLATAIGLVAAIPAVIIYNGLARAIAGYKAILSDASAEIMRHLSRDLDRQVQAAE